MPEWRNACQKKVSPASAFLPVVSCFSPAAGIGIQALGFSPVTLVTELSGIAQLWFSGLNTKPDMDGRSTVPNNFYKQ
jgi:hypothetical protein